jgi:hypothetical protein
MVLMKTHYVEWSSMMRVNLEAHRNSEVTAMRLGGLSRHEDRWAPEVLCSAVPTEMVSALSKKAMAKDSWDSIATTQIGNDHVRKYTLQIFNWSEIAWLSSLVRTVTNLLSASPA